jgi:hypothetical protein
MKYKVGPYYEGVMSVVIDRATQAYPMQLNRFRSTLISDDRYRAEECFS